MLLPSATLLIASTFIFGVEGSHPKYHDRICSTEEIRHPVEEFTDKALTEILKQIDYEIKKNLTPWDELLISENGLNRVYEIRDLLTSMIREVREYEDRNDFKWLIDNIVVRDYIFVDETIPGILRHKEICRFETPEETARVQLRMKEKAEREAKMKKETKPIEPQETVEIFEDEQSTFDKILISLKTLLRIAPAIMIVTSLILGFLREARRYDELNIVGDETETINEQIDNHEENFDNKIDGAQETTEELASKDDTQCYTESQEEMSSDDSFEIIEL